MLQATDTYSNCLDPLRNGQVVAVTTDNVGADGIVTLNGGTHTSQFLLGGSVLTGTDQLFQGAATWTGGTLTGAASTTFASSLAITEPRVTSPGVVKVGPLMSTVAALPATSARACMPSAPP